MPNCRPDRHRKSPRCSLDPATCISYTVSCIFLCHNGNLLCLHCEGISNGVTEIEDTPRRFPEIKNCPKCGTPIAYHWFLRKYICWPCRWEETIPQAELDSMMIKVECTSAQINAERRENRKQQQKEDEDSSSSRKRLPGSSIPRGIGPGGDSNANNSICESTPAKLDSSRELPGYTDAPSREEKAQMEEQEKAKQFAAFRSFIRDKAGIGNK